MGEVNMQKLRLNILVDDIVKFGYNFCIKKEVF